MLTALIVKFKSLNTFSLWTPKNCLFFLIVCSLFTFHFPLLKAQGVVTITYNGTTATVEVPDSVTGVFPLSGSSVNVRLFSSASNKEYTYRLTGSSDDGSFSITGSYKLQLLLDGLTLTNEHEGAAIEVLTGKNIDVVLAEGTVNTVSDAQGGKQKAAMYFKGHPEFKGGGTLNVKGLTAHAISASEEMQLKPSLGFINVLGAVKDGLHCGKDEQSASHNFFQMKGGNVNITNVNGDGIDCGDYGRISIVGGTLSINVPDGATALKADSIVSISGGTQNIVVGGKDAKGIRANYLVDISGGQTDILVIGDGAKGIKAKREDADDTTAKVFNGGYANFSGGDVSITALGKNLVDTATNDTVKCMGMSVDTDLVQTGGSVSITAMGDEAHDMNVKGSMTVLDDAFITRWLPWRFNAYDYQYDMTAYVAVSQNGTLRTDYDDMAVAAFIGDECVGYADFVDEGFALLRIYSNQQSVQTVSFRLYDYCLGDTFELTPSQTVIFSTSASMGTPSAPIVLSYEGGRLKGDVNADGQVGIGDIVAITNVMAGTETDAATKARADVNEDGEVGIGDIVAITNIMAGTE